MRPQKNRTKRMKRKITQKSVLDPNHIHRASVTSLTVDWGPQGPLGPTVAAQCSGRIGWDYARKTHDFVELYRGQDHVEAQRLADEHNATHHSVSETEKKS
jgi:hypothetical protein